MANSARARSTCAAGALGERLRRVNAIRSSAVSGRRGSFRWRDMGHLVSRGSPHHIPEPAANDPLAAWNLPVLGRDGVSRAQTQHATTISLLAGSLDLPP